MTANPETRAAAERVRAFLEERGPERHNVIATAGPRAARYAKPRLRVDDLCTLLAAADPDGEPIGSIPTPAGLGYLAMRREQHPKAASDA